MTPGFSYKEFKRGTEPRVSDERSLNARRAPGDRSVGSLKTGRHKKAACWPRGVGVLAETVAAIL